MRRGWHAQAEGGTLLFADSLRNATTMQQTSLVRFLQKSNDHVAFFSSLLLPATLTAPLSIQPRAYPGM